MPKGFSFLELLLCCLLFSISMLGAISCQLYARQQVLQAQQRLQASAMLTDVLSAMQGSPLALDRFQGQFEQMLPPQAACQQAGDCDAAAVAAHQLNQQLALLFSADLLPDALLCVAGNRLQPILHLSWRSLSPHQVAPAQALCAVGAGRQYVEINGAAGG
jgi:Tfp pilus assembly protein PilV